ncbi:transporter substrate-binding domain-containing protein [Maricurvus nonylphenolicus]
MAMGMCLHALPAQAAINVVYPRADSAADPRQDYPAELLDLVLQQSGKDYQLQPSDHSDTQLRALKNVENGRDLDVVWSATSIQREQRLRVIRIPIDKGLLGWRIPLIRQSDLPRFNTITTREEVQAMSAGQGHDWPDVGILRHNDFRVLATSSYSGLFKMLAMGRIDYFPRAITEAWPENERHADKALMVDPNLLMIYPEALYFFVNPEADELARDIEQGLEKLIANGEFDALFYRHYGDYLKRSNLAGRKVFHLENPFLPEATPLHRQELWFQMAPQGDT